MHCASDWLGTMPEMLNRFRVLLASLSLSTTVPAVAVLATLAVVELNADSVSPTPPPKAIRNRLAIVSIRMHSMARRRRSPARRPGQEEGGLPGRSRLAAMSEPPSGVVRLDPGLGQRGVVDGDLVEEPGERVGGGRVGTDGDRVAAGRQVAGRRLRGVELT